MPGARRWERDRDAQCGHCERDAPCGCQWWLGGGVMLNTRIGVAQLVTADAEAVHVG